MEIEELKQVFITQHELYNFLSNMITLGPNKELLERFQGCIVNCSRKKPMMTI